MVDLGTLLIWLDRAKTGVEIAKALRDIYAELSAAPSTSMPTQTTSLPAVPRTLTPAERKRLEELKEVVRQRLTRMQSCANRPATTTRDARVEMQAELKEEIRERVSKLRAERVDTVRTVSKDKSAREAKLKKEIKKRVRILRAERA